LVSLQIWGYFSTSDLDASDYYYKHSQRPPNICWREVLLSFFSTFAYVAAPIYLIEIAPPLYRGTVAGLYNTLYYMGSILATFCVYGTNLHLEGNIVWRLPLWLQMVCPGLVGLAIWFLPESPRYLIGQLQSSNNRQSFIF